MNVYDFDNTIYDGESAYDFFFSYIKVRPSVTRFIPKVISAFIKYRKGKVTTEKMMTDYAPMIRKLLLDYDRWDEFVAGFWDGHMKKIKSFYFDVRRDDDVIVTASPNLTIDEAAKRLNIKKENVVCSQIDPQSGMIVRLCMREKKIDAFRERFSDAQIDDFYTDSIENDKFFAKYAKRVFLVNGNEVSEYRGKL